MAFVQSPIASGTIQSVDYTEALRMPGVRGYIDHNDVRTDAKLGHVHDTPVFAKDKVEF